MRGPLVVPISFAIEPKRVKVAPNNSIHIMMMCSRIDVVLLVVLIVCVVNVQTIILINMVMLRVVVVLLVPTTRLATVARCVCVPDTHVQAG